MTLSNSLIEGSWLLKLNIKDSSVLVDVVGVYSGLRLLEESIW